MLKDHSPRKGYEGRRSTNKRGGMIDPENATGRKGGYRASYKNGIVASTPTPEGAGKPRNKQGSHLDTEMVSDTVEPIAWRKSGDSRTMQNPAK